MVSQCNIVCALCHLYNLECILIPCEKWLFKLGTLIHLIKPMYNSHGKIIGFLTLANEKLLYKHSGGFLLFTLVL